MRAIGLIARNVFRESVRDKVLYNLVAFAVLLMGASYLIGQLTAGQDVKIIKDLGLAATSIFGTFIAVFIGIGLVSKEVEKRSIYALLAKPIERYQLVLGKYAGLILTLAVNLAIMTTALYVVLACMAWMAGPTAAAAWDRPAVDAQMLKAIVLTFFELSVVTAIAVFFSTFSTPILSAAFTFGLFVAGRFSADLRNFQQVVESPMVGAIARAMYWVLPNLAPFDVRAQVVHGVPVSTGYLGLTIGYGLLYSAALIAAAAFIFSRRDFKEVESRAFASLGGILVVVAGLMSGAAGLQYLREQRYPAVVVEDPSLYLTSGTALERLTTGYSALAADLYWIRTIQYYGDVKLRLGQAGQTRQAGQRLEDYGQLYPLLDLTTTLDPRFNIAYRFGAIFLAEAYPGGAGRPDLAVALLEKGLRDRPDKWEYMQDIGFVHYWWRHDYKAASQWFDRASQVPGAPWFLKSLAATTLAEGGDRQSSRLMWESIRQSAEIDWLKRDAERRLMQLDVMDFLPGPQRAVDQWMAVNGAPPRDWDVLVKAGLIPGIPADATRTPYEIDPSGRVILSPRSSLYPLPDEPRRIGSPGS